MAFYWIIQNIFWPISWLILHIFYKIEVYGGQNLRRIKPPIIIASNHKTLFDGFLISSSLPWGSRIFPLRFMLEDVQFRGPVLEFLRKSGLIAFFRFIAGGFPSKRGTGIDNAIKKPLEVLKNGGTILMFPEGKLIREDSMGEFFNGTAALAMKSGTPILPMFIKLNGKDIAVIWGEVFKFNPPRSLDDGTAFLKEKILELSKKDEALY